MLKRLVGYVTEKAIASVDPRAAQARETASRRHEQSSQAFDQWWGHIRDIQKDTNHLSTFVNATHPAIDSLQSRTGDALREADRWDGISRSLHRWHDWAGQSK